MADTQETGAEVIAEYRADADKMDAHNLPQPTTQYLRIMLDRLEAALERERVLAVSIMRSKLYGIAGGLRAITARSDARQRGIHYTEVQNIAAQIENIADNGGEA